MECLAPPESPASLPREEPRHHFFAADDGIKLHYIEWPSLPAAPTIAMIHGRCGHAHWFDPLIPFLSPDYRCVSLDLRGHGDSGRSGEVTAIRFAADIAQFGAQFEGAPLILFSHSYGGSLSILAQLAHGFRPDAFILADSNLHWKPDPKGPHGAKVQSKSYPDRETILGRFRLLPGGNDAAPETLHYIAARSIRQNEDGTWTWRFDPDATGLPVDYELLDGAALKIETIDCPALVIYGEKSVGVTRENAEQTTRRFPNGQRAEIAGAHHHLMLDRPREVAAAVREFIAGLGI